jgi:hypothetical protein
VHDIADLEGAGIPGVFVLSSEFVHAAASQARALGVALASVTVPHPIQNRTDAELAALADSVVEQLTQAITAS